MEVKVVCSNAPELSRRCIRSAYCGELFKEVISACDIHIGRLLMSRVDDVLEVVRHRDEVLLKRHLLVDGASRSDHGRLPRA